MSAQLTHPASAQDEPVGLHANKEDPVRLDRVVQAKRDISAGLYDDEALVDARLLGCLDRLLADLTRCP